jgi:hypothetical protein
MRAAMPCSKNRTIASASATGSSGGTTRPVSPGVTVSERPPTSVVITGLPSAYATWVTPLWVAVRYGSTTASQALNSASTSSSGM